MEGLLEENKKLLLLLEKAHEENTQLRKERDRLFNLMYELMEKLHSQGFKDEQD